MSSRLAFAQVHRRWGPMLPTRELGSVGGMRRAYDSAPSTRSRSRASAQPGATDARPTARSSPYGIRRRRHIASTARWRPDGCGPGCHVPAAERGGLGLVVEDGREQVGPRDAVGHAVVDLQDQGPPTVLETLHHPGLPERPVTVELLRHQPADELLELGVAAGCGEGRVPEVVLESEVGIVDPDRPAQLQRDEAHHLSVPRHRRELGRDRRRNARVFRRGSLEDRARRDVHVRGAVLDEEEEGVQRAQAFHVRSPFRRGEAPAPDRGARRGTGPPRNLRGGSRPARRDRVRRRCRS